jgi:uncharacterized protein
LLLTREAHAPVLAANLLAIAACSLANFAVSDTIIFRANDLPPSKSIVRLHAVCFSRSNFHGTLCRGESDAMSLIEQIQKDLTTAMKEKDELRLSVLRMVKSALKNKEIEKMRPLENLEELQVLQTLVKQRHESVEQFTKGGRDDLAKKESREIAIIENYLPAAPSDAEIARAIADAIAETGADSIKQMGAVVKAARAKLEGKTVDGKALSDKVRERLS